MRRVILLLILSALLLTLIGCAAIPERLSIPNHCGCEEFFDSIRTANHLVVDEAEVIPFMSEQGIEKVYFEVYEDKRWIYILSRDTTWCKFVRQGK